MACIISRCSRCRREGLKTGTTKDCGHSEAVWYTKIRIGGKQVLKKIGTVKQDAKNYARTIELAKSTGGSVTNFRPMLFEELAETWFSAFAKVKCSLSTQYGYRTWLNNKIKPFFGKKLISQISNTDVELFKANLSESYTPGTICMVINLLKRIFSYAVQLDLMKNNPTQFVKTSDKLSIDIKFLTTETADKLFKIDKEPARTQAILACTMGLRISEIAALQWPALDFENSQIAIQKTTSYIPKHFTKDGVGMTLKTPKTKASMAIIPMWPETREALLRWKKSQFKDNTTPISGFVFPGKKRGVAVTGVCIRTNFKRLLVAAGLEDMRFHDLRHSFASLAIARGIPVKELQALMRHALAQTTLDRYVHLMPGALAKTVKDYGSLFKSCDTTVIPTQRKAS